ncbi:MAG: glycosyltransferase [Chloroflexi bacterium]|nr:glycosyltransferase [Chloroflexota bacterium]
MTTDLSVVIVSWNTCDLLAQCLASIYANPPLCAFEVFVVDNASSDGSPAMVRERFPKVRLIENLQNVGFACANNQAIRHSTARLVLLLNPDTEVRAGALQALADFIDAHPLTGAAGARLLNPDGTLQASCYPEPTLSRELWRLFHLDLIAAYGVYHMTDWDTITTRPVDIVLGACLLIRRQALDQVGLLSEDYFMYTEELDLCHDLRRSGWQIHWVPEAQVLHYGGQSTTQVASEMFLKLYQGKVAYFRKHHGRLSALLYKLILLSATAVRLSVSPLAWFEQSSRRQRHIALTRNYQRLFVALPRM